MKESSKKLQEDNLKFSLDTNGIEVKALAKILQDTHIAVKEIAKASDLPEPEIKVYPFKKGSFEYTLAVDALIKAVGLAMSPLAIFKLYLEIKKLRVETEKKQENKKEQLADQVIIEILRSNTSLNNSITTLLKTISQNTNGLTIEGSDGKPTTISTSEIKEILEIEAAEKTTQVEKIQTIVKNEILFLVRISKAKYGMWEFIYGDIKIMADLDKHLKDFYKDKVQSGSRVDVKLKIWQRFNNLAKAWENTKYRVIQIYGIEL